jgi:hypothetical protein
MTNKKITAYLFTLIAILFAASADYAYAQPSEAQIRKDISGAKTVSVTFGGPGKTEWSRTYKKYMWTRNFTSKVKTDDPGVFIVVKGYAAYDVRGGKYVYWRTFTTSNSYDGIADPTAAEVKALIGKLGLRKFMGGAYFNHVVGEVESMELADEPRFEWHTPNSVSFNVVAVYTEKTNDIGGKERLARTFRIRLYRDDLKSEWKDLVTSSAGVKKL